MAYRYIIYLLFFLSGLSSLIYQVLWVRSFSLVFGGTHMAVTTVLAVFMGGLALGGYLGKHMDGSSRALRIYGFLEVGIGASAILLLSTLRFYPYLYVSFAHLVNNQLELLTLGRIVFSVFALMLPTTLMGLTLPALARFSSSHGGTVGKNLSLLYGINTFGAVAGALVAGFFLLRYLTMTMTYSLAIFISLCVGLVSLFIDSRLASDTSLREIGDLDKELIISTEDNLNIEKEVPVKLVLVGIGISGFCALGYEILWTRVLSIVVGTTVYSYTLMLVAFLIGIASGGASYRLLLRFFGQIRKNIYLLILGFGLLQIIVGLLALLVSYALRSLPNQALELESWFQSWRNSGLNILQMTNFVLALLYMLAPAFFMGLAFPVAGDVVSRVRKREVGKAVGETLTYNTVGAILGASVSGFFLIYAFGIERSLQYLSLMNLGLGLTVCASLLKNRFVPWGTALLSAAFMVFLILQPGLLRVWNTKYFAIFNHNARQLFTSAEKRADIFNVTDVLYFSEGANSTISVVKVKGSSQGINVNGRTVASTAKKDQQCQYTLGHLPMLLHKNPEKVWVLGMGTGMTAGATVVHPEVKSVTVAELEKHVVGAARTFAAYNHNFLDNPKVHVVFNDGRNFLLTTKERYDVITADPIHPWSQGAAYLYTDEYYRLAASRLRSGGIICQWLPIYELTPLDLQSVVRTFANNFRYVYVWLTDYDAELVGSNDLIKIDIDNIQKRLEASPEVLSDLKKVNMGSAAQFLSYCIMGPDGSRSYGKNAPINTDNNLYLEFSAPESKGKAELVAANIASLSSHREDISPYLTGLSLSSALGTDQTGLQRTAAIYDKAHQLHYMGWNPQPEYANLMSTLQNQFPWYAPGQFLLGEYHSFKEALPQLLNEIKLALVSENGRPITVTLSAVTLKINPERVRLLIVDNRVKKIYGSVYIDGRATEIDDLVAKQGDKMMKLIDAVYRSEKSTNDYPDASSTLREIESSIDRFRTGNS